MIPKGLNHHIEISPGVCGGEPRISGHRITVRNIVLWHERMGMGVDEIAAEYDLEIAEIYAALTYYFDHRAEIDRSIQESAAFVKEMQRKTPSVLLQKLKRSA